MSEAKSYLDEKIEVSVVIPAYNAADVIGEQLQAIVEQVAAPTFEVVIADNGSTDDLFEAVGPYLGSLDIRIIDASDHRGAAYARNLGVKHARGKYILFCDADDVVVSNWVADMVSALRSDHCFVTGSSCLWDGKRSTMDQAALTASKDLYMKGNYFPSAGSGNAGYPRDAYVALGGMDLGFRGGCEDVDLSWRMQEAGYTLKFVPTAMMYYRSRSTFKGSFVQNYRFSREDVRLWHLTKERGHDTQLVSMSGSIRRLRQLPGLVATLGRDEQSICRIGNIFGAIAGNVVYRVQGKNSDPELETPDWFSATQQ